MAPNDARKYYNSKIYFFYKFHILKSKFSTIFLLC